MDDPESRYYNRLVDASQVEKDWDSAEHLVDVSPYYNYALSLTYNEEAVPGKGSAIFLHLHRGGISGFQRLYLHPGAGDEASAPAGR